MATRRRMWRSSAAGSPACRRLPIWPSRGVRVVLLEQHRFGDGASGRNGGQMNTGQRTSLDELEQELGWTRAKALFDLAEEAKAHLLEFSETNGIEIDYQPGHLSVAHKKRYVADYRAYCDYLTDRAGYPHVSFMNDEETAWRVGSRRYFGGMRDVGTGHIHPLKLLVGTARVAAAAGARLHEGTPVTSIEAVGGRVRIETASGTVTADKALMATNAYGGRSGPRFSRPYHADRFLHRRHHPPGWRQSSPAGR